MPMLNDEIADQVKQHGDYFGYTVDEVTISVCVNCNFYSYASLSTLSCSFMARSNSSSDFQVPIRSSRSS